MFKVEIGTFALVVALLELQLRCFGRQLDVLPDGIFWSRDNDHLNNRYWPWWAIGERLAFWRAQEVRA